MLLIGVLVPVLLVHSAAATTSGHKVLPVLLLVCDSTPAASASVEGITDALNGSLAFDGYMLETYQVHSTDGDATALLSALLEGDPPIAILGTPCYNTLGTFSDIVQYLHIPVISLNPLACLSEVPGHFCIQPSNKLLPDGIAAFIDHFEWQRTAIITDCEGRSLFESSKLSEALRQVNVSAVSKAFLLSNNTTEILDTSNFQEQHIIVMDAAPESAATVLCEAKSKGLSYPNYAWILSGTFPYEWWEVEAEEKENCSMLDLADALENVVTVTPVASLSCNGTVLFSYNDTLFKYAHDAKTTLEYALNKTFQTVRDDILNDMINSSVFSQGLPQIIAGLNFSGLSGTVSFNNQSRSLHHYEVLQYRKDENGALLQTRVACILRNPDSNGSQYTLRYEEGESDATVWRQGVPPDGTPLQVEHYVITPVIVLVYLAALVGIVFATFCLIFNIIFRKRRLIRLTSPNLNYLICVGCISLCLGVFAFAYPELPHTAYLVMCPLRSWLPCIGYDLCFGTINAKMWRVYHIFHNPHAVKKKAWKDWHLMLLVLLFVMIDVITLTAVASIPGHQSSPVLVEDREHKSTVNEQNLQVSFVITQCKSPSHIYWLSVVFGYKIVLQIVGVLLAFKIRKVKIKGLNDAREVRMILNITSIVLLIVIIEIFVLQDFINIHAVTYGLAMPSISFIVLGYIFIPKLIDLYRDPKGERVFTNNMSSTATSTNPLSGSAATDAAASTTNTVEALKKKITELEMELQHRDTRVD